MMECNTDKRKMEQATVSNKKMNTQGKNKEID